VARPWNSADWVLALGRGENAGGRGANAVPGEVMLAAPEQRDTALSRCRLGSRAQA
jgi:hypothetical protein